MVKKPGFGSCFANALSLKFTTSSTCMLPQCKCSNNNETTTPQSTTNGSYPTLSYLHVTLGPDGRTHATVAPGVGRAHLFRRRGEARHLHAHLGATRCDARVAGTVRTVLSKGLGCHLARLGFGSAMISG